MDSLLLGCIPVLFSERQLGHWPWHWRGWGRRAVVLLNKEAADNAVAALAAIPAEQVALKQLEDNHLYM